MSIISWPCSLCRASRSRICAARAWTTPSPFRTRLHDVRYEAEASARAGLTVEVSEPDCALLPANAPGADIRTLPTGVDTSYFHSNGTVEVPATLVFTGSMDWYPYKDAILHFIDAILPGIRREVPGMSLAVVGRARAALPPGPQSRRTSLGVSGRCSRIRAAATPWGGRAGRRLVEEAKFVGAARAEFAGRREDLVVRHARAHPARAMIKPARTRMRDSALQVIRLAGGLSAAGRSRWRPRGLLILCYHGFAMDDEHLWNPSLFVTRSHLESRLAFLAAEGYAVLPLAEGLARLSAGTLPPRAVAITRRRRDRDLRLPRRRLSGSQAAWRPGDAMCLDIPRLRPPPCLRCLLPLSALEGLGLGEGRREGFLG
jgi:hypothetical protein